MNEFFYGLFVGIIQTYIGHPFDTIKTLYQNNNKIDSFKIKNLYRGATYPLISITITNGIQFYSNDLFYNYFNNHFYSGFFSGIISSPIINLFDIYKIKKQLKIPMNNIYKKPFLGLYPTIIRESFATSIYFGTYFYMRNNYNINPFISGGTAGILCWGLTYPIDVIKTRIQSETHKTWKSAIKKRNLWSGLSICLFRSVIVNGASFTSYDFIKSLNN